MGLDAGQAAPDFTLNDQNKEAVTLSSFNGEKNVVIVFYPFTFTGICESEVCALRDEMAELADLDAQVLAISCDTVFTHKVWADQHGITYPVLADFWPHGAVAQAYGVFNDAVGASERGTFIVDKDGVIRHAEHNALGERRNVEGYAEILKSLG